MRIGEKDPDELIPGDEQIPVQIIIDKNPLAFSGTGPLNDEEVTFYIDHTVPPVASSYRPVQLANNLQSTQKQTGLNMQTQITTGLDLQCGQCREETKGTNPHKPRLFTAQSAT